MEREEGSLGAHPCEPRVSSWACCCLLCPSLTQPHHDRDLFLFLMSSLGQIPIIYKTACSNSLTNALPLLICLAKNEALAAIDAYWDFAVLALKRARNAQQVTSICSRMWKKKVELWDRTANKEKCPVLKWDEKSLSFPPRISLQRGSSLACLLFPERSDRTKELALCDSRDTQLKGEMLFSHTI